MKKIGLIDHYLDNWHANHLPQWLEDETHGAYQICYAWGSCDPADGSNPGGEANLSSKSWCGQHGVELCASAAEVVEKSDVLMVLAPNNPEMHELLCKEALASGKRTYVDKTFAPDVETAKRIFTMAEAGNTPMFSSSALRFSSQLPDVKREGIRTVQSRGGGVYRIYSIHQIEMLITLMGPDAKRVMALGAEEAPQLAIEFAHGRYATWGHFNTDFALSIRYDDGKAVNIPTCTDFFPLFVHELIDFFENGNVKAPKAETLAVIGVREAGLEALKTPGCWVNVPV